MGAFTNPLHLAFIAMVALIFLGPKRLPDLARSLGTGMREFKETLTAANPMTPAEPAMPAAAASAPIFAAPVTAAVAAPIPDVAPPAPYVPTHPPSPA